jgi:hypothetical protein
MKSRVYELKEHTQVVNLLTQLEKATDDVQRLDLSEELVLLVLEATNYKVEEVLLESATEYSEILFREFRDHGIATYVVEQL